MSLETYTPKIAVRKQITLETYMLKSLENVLSQKVCTCYLSNEYKNCGDSRPKDAYLRRYSLLK